jgi:hypothetical protein
MDIQTILALGIVGACAVYVSWKYVRMLIHPEKAACHCAHCPVATDQACRQTACPSTATHPAAPERPTIPRRAQGL